MRLHFSEKKSLAVPVSPFPSFEIHHLCRGTPAVGDARTCSLSNAELLCDIRRTHFITDIPNIHSSSVIIRPMQFQTVSDHRNGIIFQIFWLYSLGVFFSFFFHLIITIFPVFVVNPVKKKKKKKEPEMQKQQTKSHQSSQYPMQPRCLQHNRNRTVFAEPRGMYFTYFSLADVGAFRP